MEFRGIPVKLNFTVIQVFSEALRKIFKNEFFEK